MTYGLSNAAQTFQIFMDQIFERSAFCIWHIDYILVYSQTPKDQEQYLQQIFKLLDENGIIINTDKSNLDKANITFLGHIISAECSTPLLEKVLAIQQYSLPKPAREVQRFVGMYNFYRD